MSERYSKLFSLPENLYTTGAPVVIAAGALLKDNQSGNVLAQLKLQNINSQTIKAATVQIFPMDTAGDAIDETATYQYLDLNAGRDEFFGQKTAIPLPNAATRSFSVIVTEIIFSKMLIDLTQHATRCSDSSGQAQEYLIARHAAVETETVLVQICLELGAPSVICSLKECFQITDCLVYPMQIICFVFLCVQFHTLQIQVASVTVAFYLRFRHKILVDDFLQSLSLYVIYCLHPGKQWCTVCCFGYGHHNLGLIRTTTSFAVMGRSANIAVIQLYNAGKQVFFVSLTHSGTNSIQ